MYQEVNTYIRATDARPSQEGDVARMLDVAQMRSILENNREIRS
jgi:hypothetical protein